MRSLSIMFPAAVLSRAGRKAKSQMMMSVRRPAGLAAVLFVMLTIPHSASAQFSITDLGGLPGGTLNHAWGINDRGQIVGRSCDFGDTCRAFLWNDGSMIDLGTGPSSRAEAINNRGQVVGFACHDGVQETPCRGFLWEDGAITQVGTLGGTCSQAMDVNNRGQVVGMSCTAAEESHAFLWENGVMIDLGTLPGGTISEAHAVNERGQVVGVSNVSPAEFHAFLWENGVMTDLGVLPGGRASFARDINERGQIVGVTTGVPGESRAFLWEDGVMTELPGGGDAFAINNGGDIVGSRLTSAGARAFLWGAKTAIELGTLGGSTVALDINNRGGIVGISDNAANENRAVLWTKR